jgi:DivIVA domain-containing protein
VALDRQSIVRRDFPTNRRGYDPAAVDAHLDQLAAEVEALQRRAAEPATLSQQAGEQVKAIVQAAERGAQEIRESAQVEAREHIARVTEAADRLRERIEQMERDITQVGIDLRTNAERLHDDLVALRDGTGELAGVAPAAGTGEPAGVEQPRAHTPEPPAPEPPAPEPEPEPEPAPAAAAPPPTQVPNGDAAAARIVALDMALSGTPRAETERYLAEHYDVPDREALLDEVYAAAGG